MANPYTSIDEFHALLDDYVQRNFFQHITTVCDKILNQNPQDVVVQFWHAFSLTSTGQHTDAIRELSNLQNNSEVALAVTACLINTHKLADHPDKQELSTLKNKLKDLSKNSSDKALVFAGRYFWHAGKGKQAKQCLEKVLGKDKSNVEALALCGWLRINEKAKAVQYFDKALKNSAKNIVACMGRARFYENKGDYAKAMKDLNQVIVNYPDFLPGLISKAHVLMVMGNWEEALATSHRVLRKDNDAIGALRIIVAYLLARESKSLAVTNRIGNLEDALDKYESKNGQLYFEVSQLCARLAGKQRHLLNLTIQIIQKAVQKDQMNSTYMAELAYQHMLLGDYNEALECFNEASKLDEGNIAAVQGRIKCKVLQSNFREAESMLEFLAEVTSVDDNSELIYLQAILAAQSDDKNKVAESTVLLNRAVDEHVKMLVKVAPGFDHYVKYNPDFVLDLATEFMNRIGTEAMKPSDPPNPMLNKVISLLQNLVSLVPGMLGGQLLLAKASFIKGNFSESERCLVACLKLDPQFAPAQIVQAQICLARENYAQCATALELANALDFEVRTTPTFMLIKAQYLMASGKLNDALSQLEACMEITGVRRHNEMNSVPIQDRIAIFIALASVQSRLENLPEAAKVMSDANSEFENTSEATRIILADCDLAIARGAYNQALTTLRRIDNKSAFWVRAKIKMADIYLKYKKNEKLYAACYQEMAHQLKTVHSNILLGEALMKIQQPDKAIRAFEGALKLDSNDPSLASRIGRALVATHDYKRAVEYYESAAKGDPTKTYLFHELAELYLQLRMYDEAVRVLQEALHGYDKDENDIRSHINDVRSQSILAEVHRESGANPELVHKALSAAWSGQQRVLDTLSASNPDERRRQQTVAADLCHDLAKSFQKKKDSDKAVVYFQEALKQDDNHADARLALARFYLMKNDLEQCKQQCMTMTRIDPNNKEASMMLADLMFRQNEHEAATYYFQQLLQNNPTNYGALDKLIQLFKRAGRLRDAPRFLKLAEKSSPKAPFEPGYNYCNGLYNRFANNPQEALRKFNLARKDGTWGAMALEHMIEVCLNPDNTGLFQESTEAKGDHSDMAKQASMYLKELTFTLKKSNPQRYTVLEGYIHMATKSKSRIETALQTFQSLCKEDKDYVPGLLGMANAYMLLNQVPKARNQLKRIYKMKLMPEFSTEYEKAWLMLADIYIGNAKYDLAQDLCRKCLNNNKSCAKAYEMMGLIMEKEQAYRDASENYENAWNFMNESSSTVGFKLAFNYLKAKRYVEAIDVCHKVLEKNPDYPKIRKEILDKARAALRP